MDEFYDPAVSGGDPVESRAGFIAMLKRIEGNGVRTIIVETASRFARDLMVQEVGYAMLTERGIELIAADSPQSFIEDTPTARLIRQVLGAVSEFDKAMTVAKLRGLGIASARMVRPEPGGMVARRLRAERTTPSCAPRSSLRRNGYGASGRRAGSGPIARSRRSYFRTATATPTAGPSRRRRSKPCFD